MRKNGIIFLFVLIYVLALSANVACAGDGSDASKFVVGWGTLSLIASGIAQGMNRSGLAWFMTTLILGPLGLFFLVLAGKKN